MKKGRESEEIAAEIGLRSPVEEVAKCAEELSLTPNLNLPDTTVFKYQRESDFSGL